MQLQHIAQVQMGLAFRARIETQRDGDVAVIQMRDLGGSGRFPDLATVTIPDLKDHHLIRPGDLVFRSRGMTTTATLIDAPPRRAIIAAPLLRIRVTGARVLPAYLCWFINQPSSQAFLRSRATGTALALIGKSILDTLEVPIPSRARQKQIAALAALSEREQAILAEVAGRRKKWSEKTLMQLARAPETGATH